MAAQVAPRYDLDNMLSRFLIAIGTGLLLMGECVSEPETRYGRVEVIATDLTGEPVTVDEVAVFASREQVMTTRSSKLRLRYGSYQLRVHTPGFDYAWRTFVVDQADMVVRVELVLGHLGCPQPPATISGQIQRLGAKGELWVKAIPVRGTGGSEARANKSGDFVIGGLEHSSYLVVVMQDELVLHQQVVKTYPVDSALKLSIDLR